MPADGPEAELVQEISLIPETASDSAVRFLRAMIFSGELGPGDRLPPERDLGARLGISRMTLRLALKALESTGYIVTTRGSHGGSRVADADSLVRCWNLWMREHAGELDDIFEFREAIESKLAALLADRRSEEDLQAMEDKVQRRSKQLELSSTDIDDRAIAGGAAQPACLQRGQRRPGTVPRSIADAEGWHQAPSHQSIRIREREGPATCSRPSWRATPRCLNNLWSTQKAPRRYRTSLARVEALVPAGNVLAVVALLVDLGFEGAGE